MRCVESRAQGSTRSSSCSEDSQRIKQGRVESKKDDLKVCRLPYGAVRFLAPLEEGNARRPLSKETIALCPRVRKTLAFANPCEKRRDEGGATLTTVEVAAAKVDLGASVGDKKVHEAREQVSESHVAGLSRVSRG